MKDQEFAITMVYPIMKTMAHRGLDFDRFSEHIGFNRTLLDDVEARISGFELERLMKEAAKYTGDDHFGLRQGALTDIADLGVLGYVMMHSVSVVRALEAYQRYNVILCSGYNLDWEIHEQSVVLRMYSVSALPTSRQCIEDMASSIYYLLLRMTNRQVALDRVSFTHAAPEDLTPYADVFGLIPEFGCEENVFVFDQEVLDYPILYADQRLRMTFESIAEEIRSRLLSGKELSDQVFQWLMACMPTQFPDLQETAKRFRMSARTLQAKLQEEHTSYHDLATQVRKEWAVTYLRKQEYSISEIAYLLHYSEPSAFHNAFKKWTGVTPGQYRSSVLSELRETV